MNNQLACQAQSHLADAGTAGAIVTGALGLVVPIVSAGASTAVAIHVFNKRKKPANDWKSYIVPTLAGVLTGWGVSVVGALVITPIVAVTQQQ